MSDKKKQYLKILANFGLLGVIIFCLVEFLPIIIDLFMPFIIAFIVAMIAEPLVDFLESKLKFKRKYTAFGIIALVIGGLGLGIIYTVKWLYNFIVDIINNWDRIFGRINDLTAKFDVFLKKVHIDINEVAAMDSVSKLADSFSEKFVNITSSFVLNIPVLVFEIVITSMAAYFIILSHNAFFDKLAQKNEKVKKIKTEVIDQIFKYCKAQFKIMFIIFIILLIGLGVMGIDYFIPIALLIAFVDLLPILGTGTIMIPWTILAVIDGDYAKAMFLFAIYIIAMVARQVLQPKIIGETMEFPAFPTLIVMWLGFKLFSLVGLFLSVPFGIVFLKLYKAGVFDVYVDSIKYIAKDVKDFLKIKFK